MGLLLKHTFRLIKNLCLLFLVVAFLYGCGSSDESKVNFAITEAEIYLSNANCNAALKALEAVGNQKANARYLQTLASAYGCQAGYNTLTVFSDLKTFATNLGNTPARKLGWLSQFSNATSMTTGDDIDFLNLQKAIDTLLYAGGLSTSNNPSTSSRAGLFSSDDALDINVQLFYMILDQLSRYIHYYGCYDGTNAEKGQTRADPVCTNSTHECFAHYPNVAFGSAVEGQGGINTFLTGGNLTGDCKSRTAGHTDLRVSNMDNNGVHYNSSQVSAMCNGVVLMNNFRTVLSAISGTLSSVPGFDALSSISDLFDTAEAYGTTAGITTIMTTLSKTKCEADFGANDNGKDDLGIYFVLFFETLFT